MQVIDADFDRRIDLPGVGPCPRPVDIDQGVTGFTDLVSLRVYSFPAGETIHGDAEDDELLIVAFAGEAEVAIDQAAAEVARFDLAAGRAAFLPPGASYRLSTVAPTDVAYARVKPINGAAPPVSGFAPTAGELTVADHASGMDVTLKRLAAGAALTLPGGAERLVHVAAAGGAVLAGGQTLRPWQSAAISADEALDLRSDAGATVLVVTARR